MITRVTAPLRDPNNSFVTTGMITDWLNDAQIDLASRLRIMRNTATGVSAGNTIALPADFIEALDLELDDGSTDQVPDDYYESWERSDAEYPIRSVWRIKGSTIEIYPTPEAGTAYVLSYVSLPTNLEEGVQETSDLPVELHPRMVKYALAQAKWLMNEEGMGDRAMAEYENGLPAHPLGRPRNFAGPPTLRREPSNWDGGQTVH